VIITETAVKLDAGHILRLISREADAEGWAKVSKLVYPLVAGVPSELVELQSLGEGGRVRLTEQGQSLIYAMAWL
jgi:hypothetical protein